MSLSFDSPAAKRTFAACLCVPLLVLAGSAFADGDGVWKGGANVYEKVCGRCHETGIGPELKGRQLPSPYIVAVARNGLRAMPAWPASFIDDKALQQVADYISQAPAPAAKP